MSWYLKALKKYAVFDGRARREEFWFFWLCNFMACFALIFVDAAMGTLSREPGMGLFGSIYLLAIILPSISVCVRRLHDTDHSGWWIWISLIPFLGAVWLFFLMVLDGEPGENQYGRDPKDKHRILLWY